MAEIRILDALRELMRQNEGNDTMLDFLHLLADCIRAKVFLDKILFLTERGIITDKALIDNIESYKRAKEMYGRDI